MYLRIMLPLARPSLATIAIFYFMWIWNDFIYPLVYVQSNEKYTVPLGIMFLNGQYDIEWGAQMAGLTVATVIPLIVYYIFQKQFIRGITAGALKG
jgi:ABC-type glycerol-3-phosphate transport system permease component